MMLFIFLNDKATPPLIGKAPPLKPVKPPRQGWDEAFKEMHERGEDELLMDDILDDDIIEEW